MSPVFLCSGFLHTCDVYQVRTVSFGEKQRWGSNQVREECSPANELVHRLFCLWQSVGAWRCLAVSSSMAT